MYNNYIMMQKKAAASANTGLFNTLKNLGSTAKKYLGGTQHDIGYYLNKYNPYTQDNIKTFGSWIRPNKNEIATSFLGKTRNALGSVINDNPQAIQALTVTGTAVPALYGGYKLINPDSFDNDHYEGYKMVTSSINDYDMNIEYDAAANQAAFAENMYNEAVEKMASIEEYMEKEAAGWQNNPVSRAVYNAAAKGVRWGNSVRDSSNRFGLGDALGKPGVGNSVKRNFGKGVAALAHLAQKNPNVAAALAVGATAGAGVGAYKTASVYDNVYDDAYSNYLEKEAAGWQNNPISRAVYNTAAKGVRWGNSVRDSANRLGLGDALGKPGVGNSVKRNFGKGVAALAHLAQKNPNVAAALAVGATAGAGVGAYKGMN